MMTESSSPAERPVQFLFVCLSRRAEGPPATTMTEDETRKEHRAYLQDLHDRGLLYGSGPQRDSSGNDTGGAVHILQNVDDIETAREIAAQEPFIREGFRTLEVFPWRRVWFAP
jgi:uncharacterized protein YciI